MRRATVLLGAAVLAGCGLMPSASRTPTQQPTASETARPSLPASLPAALSPSPSSEPAFSLELPEGRDPRAVSVEVQPAGDELVVTVTNTTDQRIDEIVLRWSTDLDAVYFIMPFIPSDDRIRDGGRRWCRTGRSGWSDQASEGSRPVRHRWDTVPSCRRPPWP